MSRSRPLALALMLTVLVALFGSAVPPASALTLPAVDRAGAIARGIDYLRAKQLANGGFEGFTPGQADEFTTSKVAIAIGAAGRPSSTLTSSNGVMPIVYLMGRAVAYTHASGGTGPLFPGRAGQLAVAVAACEMDPTSFGGMNLIGELQASYNATTGAYTTSAREGFSTGEPNTINQLWAILGLAAALQPIPSRATDFLISLRETDASGGWGFGFGSDVDTTALALQALIASGNVAPDHAAVLEGLAFLRRSQASSGGWEAFGSLSADSTASAVQALASAGFAPATAAWLSSGGRTPMADLVGLQAADGSFGGNALGTAHAIAGLAEAPLPIFNRTQRARLALSWVASRQNTDGSWNGFSGPDVGATADVVLAFAAGRFDPSTIRTSASAPTAIDYLSSRTAVYAATGPDAAGKLAVAVAAAGRDPRSFGGVNLVTLINTHYRPTDNAFGDKGNTWHQSFALLGLAAAGEPVPANVAQTLAALQQSDGGWKYDLSPGEFNLTSADSTGIALQALARAGGYPAGSAPVASALAFLRAKQDAGGGWSNANGTALAIQALIPFGGAGASWSRNGLTPYEALATYQKRDGPFFFDSSFRTDNGLATWQAIPALLGTALPIQSSAPLGTFTAVARGPDPDRTLTQAPRAYLAPTGLDVALPYGGDLNRNATATVSWRVAGGQLQSVPLTRADGFFTGLVPTRAAGSYELRATFADPDGLQGASELTTTATIPSHTVRLQLVARQTALQR